MNFYKEDFQEVSHCGANTTLEIHCDEHGKTSCAVGLVMRRPSEMVAVGIYISYPEGTPISDYVMGGIGQPFDPPCPNGAIAVTLASDSLGCFGHQCPRCSGYFRNGHHAAVYPQTCPYCGLRAPAFRFLTPSQRRFLKHVAETICTEINQPMEPNTTRESEIDMEAIANQKNDQPKPQFYYTAETQQTRYTCELCGEFNDIRGLYGYCAACAHRNNSQLMSEALSKLRNDLNSDKTRPEDAVRNAVSLFDANCRDFVSQLVGRIPMKNGRKAEFSRLVFQSIESETFKLLATTFDVQPLRGLETGDLSFLKMMFERRHVFEHNSGIVDQNYLDKSGDSTARIGDLLRENRENSHKLIGLLARIVQNVHKDFHEIFPPTAWPVEYYDRHRRRRK